MSAITSTTENYYASSTAESDTSSTSSELTSDDFLTLLLTQLQNQDPLSPMDNAEMLSQISEMEGLNQQIAQTEALDSMNEMMSTMSDCMLYMTYDNRLQTASSMVGMYVTGTDSDGNAMEGMVSSVSMSNGEVTLNLHTGDTMPYENVSDVTMAVVDSESTEE